MDNLVKFKAGMVSMTLTLVELQRLGLGDTVRLLGGNHPQGFRRYQY